jgi:hypothetical protein
VIRRAALACVVALLLASPRAEARFRRSHQVTAEFQREHACPITGSAWGKCHGYVIDHIVLLACGGADAPLNMQ